MEITQLQIEAVKPYINNPRRNESAVDKVVASIEEFGFQQPIVVDKNYVIIVGHTRLLAAQKLQLKTVPVVIASALNDAQVKAYRIADNRSNQESSWDDELLRLELRDLQNLEYDLKRTCFNDDEIDRILTLEELPAALTDEDDCPPLPAEPTTKPGDIYILGRHRLMCGDSTNTEHLTQLMGGSLADMIFTDPPYNVDYNPDTRPIGGRARSVNKLGSIKNDKMDSGAFTDFLRAVFNNAITGIKGGASVYVCHADNVGIIFRTVFEEIFKLASVLIWAKNNFAIGRADYHWMHEPILYGWQKGCTHKWHGDRSQTTIWNISRESGANYVHPTQKPVALVEKAITNSSKSGDLILDLFGGSGSTLMACEKLQRGARLMELDPKYCDVIVQRWEAFTGKKASLVS